MPGQGLLFPRNYKSYDIILLVRIIFTLQLAIKCSLVIWNKLPVFVETDSDFLRKLARILLLHYILRK